jgi:7,8-dihydroneopterin aldolase/epimerase/oxygenase
LRTFADVTSTETAPHSVLLLMWVFSSLPKALGLVSGLRQKQRLVELLELYGRHSYDRITLHGLKFHGYHGALPAEQVLGQKFLVDAVLFCDLRAAGASDKLEDTVNYAEVYSTMQQVMEGPPKQLLECVADSICRGVFESQPLVHGVQVAIKKPHVALPGSFDHLGIQITRWRDRSHVTPQ